MMEELDWCSIFVEKASWLGTPFDENEIRKSEFDWFETYDPDQMAVSQDFWDVVKVDLLKVFWELFLHQVVKACTSITYICYIP